MIPQREGSIPLVVVEEHHEAFYVWHYAVHRGWMSQGENTLLHVDAHADIMLPRLRRPLHSLSNLADVADFTYRELEISNFIWPAVYQGFFTRLLWLKHRHRSDSGGWRSMLIASKNSMCTEFSLSAYPASSSATAPDAKVAEYAPVTTAEVLNTEQPIIVDIDLDYFCSNTYPELPRNELEITRAEFEEFTGNPYHFLRISPSDKISAVSRAGRFFLVYNDYHPERPSREARLAQIDERIADFVRYLRAYSVIPRLIVVCRSYYCGYTPADCIDYLQSSLMRALEQLFPLHVFSIRDVLPSGALQFPAERSARSESLGALRA